MLRKILYLAPALLALAAARALCPTPPRAQVARFPQRARAKVGVQQCARIARPPGRARRQLYASALRCGAAGGPLSRQRRAPRRACACGARAAVQRWRAPARRCARFARFVPGPPGVSGAAGGRLCWACAPHLRGR